MGRAGVDGTSSTAQIHVTNNISAGIERTVALTESETVMELVDDWLQAMIKPADSARD